MQIHEHVQNIDGYLFPGPAQRDAGPVRRVARRVCRRKGGRGLRRRCSPWQSVVFPEGLLWNEAVERVIPKTGGDSKAQSLVLKVVFDVVGLESIHVASFFWATIVQVVVDHVINHIATESPHKDRQAQAQGHQHTDEDVETPDYKGGWDWREDQTRAIERGLVVLAMQEEVKCDEVIVTGWRSHVEQEAMDKVLY